MLRSGSLKEKVEKISDHTDQLDRLIAKRSRSEAVPIRQARSKPKELFLRSLKEIETDACRLHRAFANVWACSEHQSHCINLRLEPRLRGVDKGDKEKHDQASFAVGFAASQVWRALEINVAEEATNRLNQTVSFHGVPSASTETALSDLVVIEDLCQRASAAGLTLCLDHHDRLLGHCSSSSTATRTDPSKCTTVTLRELLIPSKVSEISPKQSMELALTLVSSFLQLHSTPWLRDLWCARDVILLRSDEKLDVDHPFISQSYPLTSSNKTLEDSERIFALGIILLQIITHTPIEDQRSAADMVREDPYIVRTLIKSDSRIWLNCFADAIKACSSLYYGGFDLDLTEPDTRMEVIEKVLVPFQRDLGLVQG